MTKPTSTVASMPMPTSRNCVRVRGGSGRAGRSATRRARVVKKRMCSRYRGKSGPYALMCCPAWIVSAWSTTPVNSDTRKSSRVSLPIHACRGRGRFASASTKAYAAGAARPPRRSWRVPATAVLLLALRGVHEERAHPQQQREGEQSEAGVEAGEGIAGVDVHPAAEEEGEAQQIRRGDKQGHGREKEENERQKKVTERAEEDQIPKEAATDRRVFPLSVWHFARLAATVLPCGAHGLADKGAVHGRAQRPHQHRTRYGLHIRLAQVTLLAPV